jgi:hypothetical protein
MAADGPNLYDMQTVYEDQLLKFDRELEMIRIAHEKEKSQLQFTVGKLEVRP